MTGKIKIGLLVIGLTLAVPFLASQTEAAGIHYVSGKVRAIDRKKVVFQTKRVRFTLLRAKLNSKIQKQLESPKAQKIAFNLALPVNAIAKTELIY